MLVFELGAFALLCWAVWETLWGTTREERDYHRARPAHKRNDIEILPPGQPDLSSFPRSRARYVTLFGFPFKRTGLGWPLAAFAVWIAVSVVPIDGSWLAVLSPQAHALRVETAMMGSAATAFDSAPTSLSPFLTLRSLWLFFACVALVFVGSHLASSPRRVERLTQLLFLTGVGFGIYGMAQWLSGLQELLGRDSMAVNFRATASFGNRNHYALFMEMLLLCGLGWIGMSHARARVPTGGSFARRIEAGGGKLFFIVLGVVIVSLGLIFSLSRAGIAIGLLGCGLLVLIRPRPAISDALALEARRVSRPGAGAFAMLLVVLGTSAWIGLAPVAQRFQLLPGEWDAEQHRLRVWTDALEAIPDYTLMGSGLSSFRYVFPHYRSFGGRDFYSWAHNDYLQLLVELGLPGLLLLAWLVVAFWRAARRARSELYEEPGLAHLHAGFLAAIVAVALHSFVDFGLHLMANTALFSLLLGLATGIEPESDRDPA